MVASPSQRVSGSVDRSASLIDRLPKGLQDRVFARRAGGSARPAEGPEPLAWHFADLLTHDGFAIDVLVTCDARVNDTPADRQVFYESLLTSRAVASCADVAEHLRGVVEPAVRAFVHKHDVAAALNEAPATLAGELGAALKAATFGLGIRLISTPEVVVRSEAYERHVRELAAAEGRRRQLEQAADLLTQLRRLREDHPDVPAGTLLEQLSPADRGDALRQALLAEGHDTHSTLLAVGGDAIVRIGGDELDSLDVAPLTPVLGPARSVQVLEIGKRRQIVVGVQTGVLRLDALSLSPIATHAAPGEPISPDLARGGFNAVTLVGPDTLLASHSELGLIAWSLDDEVGRSVGAPDALGGSPRLATAVEHVAVAAVGSRLVRFDALHESEPVTIADSGAGWVALLPDGKRLIAVAADGEVHELAGPHLEIVRTLRLGGRLTSATLVPWLGDVRLVVSPEAGPPRMIGLDDAEVAELLGGVVGLREMTGATDLIAGVWPDRQRVTLWRPWDAREPAASVHLTSRTRHRVADIAVL